ncbi:MAG TPA: hypothetical protein VK178_14915 [Opitutaceae bacterium]|nr:hypothetical protein [Opitutaceae bacterium]
MVIHREITLRSRDRTHDSRDLVSYLSRFCGLCSARYLYRQQESEEYATAIHADACIIQRHDRFPYPNLAFATGDGGTVHLTNIVPRDVGEIDVATYNSFAAEFATGFRQALGREVAVRITADTYTLADVVSGQKTRSLFKRYLGHHPTSFHPNDIERLDLFTCALLRYAGGRIDTDRLRGYLIDSLGWKKEHADWCCNRIEVGLDVLRANRTFRI